MAEGAQGIGSLDRVIVGAGIPAARSPRACPPIGRGLVALDVDLASHRLSYSAIRY